jgi:hypothetical protein
MKGGSILTSFLFVTGLILKESSLFSCLNLGLSAFWIGFISDLTSLFSFDLDFSWDPGLPVRGLSSDLLREQPDSSSSQSSADERRLFFFSLGYL